MLTENITEMLFEAIPVKGYDGRYLVLPSGRVWSTRKRGSLSEKQRKDGYTEVNLWKDNRCKSYLVHRLVAEAFIPNPDGLPQVNHKDENRRNNNRSNLEWCNSKYNSDYGTGRKRAVKSRKDRKVNCKPVVCLDANNMVFESIAEAEEVTGVNRSCITRVCNGERKTAGGMRWEWQDNKPIDE